MSVPVFFDVDHTLLLANTARLYGRYLRRKGAISRRDVVRNLWYLTQYKLAILRYEEVLVQILQSIVNRPEIEVEEEGREWYVDEVHPHVSKRAVRLVDEHLSRGHVVTLLTASNRYVSEPLAADVGIEHIICTQFEVSDGKFTGHPILPACYGEGKLVLAERWCSSLGLDIEQGYFYTDSYTDLPTFERVGRPRAVNPDPRLKRYAKKHGIPILRFDR